MDVSNTSNNYKIESPNGYVTKVTQINEVLSYISDQVTPSNNDITFQEKYRIFFQSIYDQPKIQITYLWAIIMVYRLYFILTYVMLTNIF